jgi:hypothetical protein
LDNTVPTTRGAPGRAIRVFVYAFIATVLVCGLASIELWPLSGFRLFSQRRSDVAHGWSIMAVSAEGEEQSISFADLPLFARNTTKLVDGFAEHDQGERDEVCRAWAEAARSELGLDAARIRIYETARPVWTDRDQPRPTAERELRWTCAGTGP